MNQYYPLSKWLHVILIGQRISWTYWLGMKFDYTNKRFAHTPDDKMRLQLNLNIPLWKLNLRRNSNNSTYRLLSSFYFLVSETSFLEFLLSNHTFWCSNSCFLQCIPKLKVFLKCIYFKFFKQAPFTILPSESKFIIF